MNILQDATFGGVHFIFIGQVMHRYPKETKVTAEIAMAALEVHNDVISKAETCSDLWQILFTAARNAARLPEPDWPAVKALWLLSDACSMTLDGDSTNDPFGPMAVFEHGRSAISADFEPDVIALFSAVSRRVENRALRARLADAAWIEAKPKSPEDARRAIDAYVEVVPNEDSWVSSLKEWRRAITLCMQLRKGAEGRLERIRQDLVHLAESALQREASLGRAVALLLFERNLADDDGQKFAELLDMRGVAIKASGGDIWYARTYWTLAERWFSRLANHERAADMSVKIALSHEEEADHRIAIDSHTGHLVAQSFLGDAVQILRKVPTALRPSRQIEGTLLRLLGRITESGEKAVKSLPTISAGKTDITELVEMSEQMVKGKEPFHALHSFIHLYPGANLAQMTETAENSLREFSFSRFFGSSYMSGDGRVIAKTPGGIANETPEDHARKIFDKVMQHYIIGINFVCHAQIVPAWRTFMSEHTMGKADILELVSLAAIIPPGRANLFAKGLWEGFDGDFTSAIYILAPQVEHLVRWHLKQISTTTTNLDKVSIENEVGLSKLVEMPELESIFNVNTIFEMRALFCTAHGPNLRNEAAHGLLSADDRHSVATIYGWWWVLRLLLENVLSSRLAAAQSPELLGPMQSGPA